MNTQIRFISRSEPSGLSAILLSALWVLSLAGAVGQAVTGQQVFDLLVGFSGLAFMLGLMWVLGRAKSPANELARQGIQTWVFITPSLPGITDVRAMIQALPADIPVYLDKLRLEAGSKNTVHFLKYLGRYYPSLKPRYLKLIETGSDPYYQELKETYCNNQRIKFVFGEA
jgi:hypothetical protein